MYYREYEISYLVPTLARFLILLPYSRQTLVVVVVVVVFPARAVAVMRASTNLLGGPS